MMREDIRPDRVVVARAEALVAALPDMLWDRLANVPDWSDWNGAQSLISWQDPFGHGSWFRWTRGALPVTAVVSVMNRPVAFGWTERSWIGRGEVTWRLEPELGGTRIICAIEARGLMVRLFPKSAEASARAWAQVLVDQLSGAETPKRGPRWRETRLAA